MICRLQPIPIPTFLVVVQSLSRVQLFATPWTVACQVSLSFTISQSLLRFMSIEFVMMPNYLILCHSFLLLPLNFPSIRVFLNESALHIRWTKYWSFSYSNSPSNECSGLISLGLIGLIFCSPWDSQESSPAPQFKSINSLALSLLSGPTLKSRLCAEYSEMIWEK